MSNLQIALNIAKEEIKEGIELMKADEVNSYSEFIESVYYGESKQFKDDLEYAFNQYNNESEGGLEFTDDMEIIDGNEIVSYRKFINILKKEVWK